MKENSVFQFKPHIPKMDFNELSRMQCNKIRSPISDSSIKICRSTSNVFENQFDSSLIVMNRQSNTNKQLLNIPIPTRSRNIFLKKQAVFSFYILSEYKKSFKDESNELREHIKFLLKQIKKLKQAKTINSNCSYNELFSQLKNEINSIKTQLKDKEERLSNLKKTYDQSNRENIALKNSLQKRKEFNSKSLHLVSKEHIELHSNKKDLMLNDLATFDVNNDDITKVLSSSQQNYPLSPYYIKKIGLGGKHKKRESANSSISTSLTIQPIIEKKLSLAKSFNCLYSFKPNESIIKFDIANGSFTTLNYKENCNMNSINSTTQQPLTLNGSNGLFILGGVDCDQFYYYDAKSNCFGKLQSSLYSHNKGAMILYASYLCEQRVICLGSDTTTKVEMYHTDCDKWTELPEITTTNGISSRIDTGYLILNSHQLIAFFGFDSIKNNYINSIDYLPLSNPIKWTQIIVDIQSFQRGTIPLLRGHTALRTKYESFNNSQIIYLLGGCNSFKETNLFLGINIKADLSHYSLISNNNNKQSLQTNSLPYTFSSSLYEYSNQGTNRKKLKYTFDTTNNIHIIDTEIMKHEIFTYL